VPHVYFEPNGIRDRNRKEIFDLTVHPYEFFAYEVEASVWKGPSCGISFFVTCVFDNGVRVADSLTIEWDQRTGLFKLFVPDQSMFE
jgi:hypothetical protein